MSGGREAAINAGDTRHGVSLTNLDQPLFDGATKRDLVDYLEAVADRLVPELRDRPLSVIRALRGERPFMQKNLPKYAPPWIRTTSLWAESSGRDVTYALCDDLSTLLWFGNQRAIEYHPTLMRTADWMHPTHLVLDIDPPNEQSFPQAVQTTRLVGEVLADAGLSGAVKLSGAKGLHVFVPIDTDRPVEDVAAATRALAARAERLDPALVTTAFIRDDRGGKVFLDSTRAGGATIVAAYSPRARPGLPVSFPVAWTDLDDVRPGDFTVHNAAQALANHDPWQTSAWSAQHLDADLVSEGHTIPVARVQAMHEGKRRARARRQAGE